MILSPDSLQIGYNHRTINVHYPTDTGKIMKVVFSGSTTYDPVVAEEITVRLCGSRSVVYYCGTCAMCKMYSLILMMMML